MMDVLKANLDKVTCANLFNNKILLAVLYACEIWALMKKEQHLLTAQRTMERLMLGILLRDQA